MLSYLEQNQIYNAMNFQISAADNCDNGVNQTCEIAVISSFLCPSSPGPNGQFSDASSTPWLNGRYPGTNYWGSIGPGPCPWSSNVSMRGVLGTVSPGSSGSRSNRDVTDGTSNTIAFGEWKMGDFDQNKLSLTDAINIRTNTVGQFGNWNGNTNMPDVGTTVFQQFLNTCAGTAKTSVGTGDNKSTVGRCWTMGMMGQTLGTPLLAPNPQYPNCNMESWGGDMDAPGMYNLSSYHPGGANVALCDGSVRFLKSTTNLQTIWSLGSRNGGEVISADSF
jgi:prepilin-type processing-associated H-X9-DG protein